LIPIPRSQDDLTIGSFEYKIGLILNHTNPFPNFDQALDKAGIHIAEDGNYGKMAGF
jgi:hypothetical protein